MADPRLISLMLDEETIGWRSADIEQERRIAIFDLLEHNSFAPVRAAADGYAGPYRLTLSAPEGRLALGVSRADGSPIETHILGLARFRRAIRDYLQICDSYFQAIRQATPAQIETVDMARRGVHNTAAELLQDALGTKVAIDFDTARRLFTVLCTLHLRP